MDTPAMPRSNGGTALTGKQVQNTSQQQSMGSKNETNVPQEAKEDIPETRMDEFLRHLFGSCGGVVDVATLIFQATCRGRARAEANREAEKQQKMKMSLRQRYMATGVKAKRQGGTLEFSTQGGFDDDVSALSAHTLEEMERIDTVARILKKPLTPIPSRTLRGNNCTPQMRHQELDKNTAPLCPQGSSWTYQIVSRQTSNDSRSIGVSTSGSSDERPEEAGEEAIHEEQKSYTRIIT
jgi:hypothetical protein